MKKTILFIISLLFGLMFINAGLNKFFNYMPASPKDMPEAMQKAFGAFMTIGWLMPLVGIFEIVGGLLFIFGKTRALGAIIILPIMVGIVLTAIYQSPNVLPMAVVLAAINVWMIIDNRAKYLPMIS